MTYLVLGLLFSPSVPRFSVLRSSRHFGGRAIIRLFRWLGISPNVREIVVKDFFAARPPYCYGLERTDRTVGEHLGEGIQSPVIKHRTIAIFVPLLVLFHYHLSLTQITNHHSSLNQFVSNEMRCFMQSVALLVAFFLSNPLIDCAQMDRTPRLLFALVTLRSQLVQLAVVPLSTLEATHMVETALLVHAAYQRLDSRVKSNHCPWPFLVFLRHVAKKGREVAPR